MEPSNSRLAGGSPAKATILDAHQHFWVYNEHEYTWMGEGMDALRRDHLPPDLAPLLERSGVLGTVAVQARRTVAETEWLLSLAQQYPFILGVVGWVDMRAPDLAQTLGRLAESPRLVGIREVIHDMHDPDFILSAEHVGAIRLLAELDLTYDLLLRPPQLKGAVTLVDRFPEQPFVVDHIAKPNMRTGRLPRQVGAGGHEQWSRGISELAERPNVYCKLSGLLTECDWTNWRVEHVTPYLDLVLEAFGPQRLMIGSDWPVCICAASYATTMELVVDYVSTLSGDERSAILRDTCVRFYRLALPDDTPAPLNLPDSRRIA